MHVHDANQQSEKQANMEVRMRALAESKALLANQAAAAAAAAPLPQRQIKSWRPNQRAVHIPLVPIIETTVGLSVLQLARLVYPACCACVLATDLLWQ